jgi:hypothetical protein
MRRLSMIACLAAASLATSGCAWLSEQPGFAALRPPATGYSDGTESSDPWVMQAAAEGRRDFRTESANDPLNLRRFFMSQKARDIETNVGIIE